MADVVGKSLTLFWTKNGNTEKVAQTIHETLVQAGIDRDLDTAVQVEAQGIEHARRSRDLVLAPEPQKLHVLQHLDFQLVLLRHLSFLC